MALLPVSFGRRPPTRPRSRAAASPASVLSRISDRSNSAKAPSICIIMRPGGVVVSTASVRERKPAPAASIRSRRVSMSLRDRANRSSFQTTTMSPGLSSSRRWCRAGRSRSAHRRRAPPPPDHSQPPSERAVARQGLDRPSWKRAHSRTACCKTPCETPLLCNRFMQLSSLCSVSIASAVAQTKVYASIKSTVGGDMLPPAKKGRGAILARTLIDLEMCVA